MSSYIRKSHKRTITTKSGSASSTKTITVKRATVKK